MNLKLDLVILLIVVHMTVCKGACGGSLFRRQKLGNLLTQTCPGLCDIITLDSNITELDCVKQCKNDASCAFYKHSWSDCHLCTSNASQHAGATVQDVASFTAEHGQGYIMKHSTRFDFQTCLYFHNGKPVINDCSGFKANGFTESGTYTLTMSDLTQYDVYCDMVTDGKAWTVFQRRQDGSVDFYRNWEDYRLGFGSLTGEFWLGNDALSDLTSQGHYEMRIDMGEFSTPTFYALYDRFSVDGDDSYRLTLGAFTGDIGDSMGDTSYQSSGICNNIQFSTFDQDNDQNSVNCAESGRGGWWYNACYDSNLNGLFTSSDSGHRINWQSWSTTLARYLQFVEMKMRLLP